MGPAAKISSTELAGDSVEGKRGRGSAGEAEDESANPESRTSPSWTKPRQAFSAATPESGPPKAPVCGS